MWAGKVILLIKVNVTQLYAIISFLSLKTHQKKRKNFCKQMLLHVESATLPIHLHNFVSLPIWFTSFAVFWPTLLKHCLEQPVQRIRADPNSSPILLLFFNDTRIKYIHEHYSSNDPYFAFSRRTRHWSPLPPGSWIWWREWTSFKSGLTTEFLQLVKIPSLFYPEHQT